MYEKTAVYTLYTLLMAADKKPQKSLKRLY